MRRASRPACAASRRAHRPSRAFPHIVVRGILRNSPASVQRGCISRTVHCGYLGPASAPRLLARLAIFVVALPASLRGILRLAAHLCAELLAQPRTTPRPGAPPPAFSCGRPPTPPRVHRASCALFCASRAAPALRLRCGAPALRHRVGCSSAPLRRCCVCAGRRGRCCASLLLPALGLMLLLQLLLMLLPVLRAAAVAACCHSRCRRLDAAIEPARSHLLSRAAHVRRSQRRAICSRALLVSTIDRHHVIVDVHARGRARCDSPSPLLSGCGVLGSRPPIRVCMVEREVVVCSCAIWSKLPPRSTRAASSLRVLAPAL